MQRALIARRKKKNSLILPQVYNRICLFNETNFGKVFYPSSGQVTLRIQLLELSFAREDLNV